MFKINEELDTLELIQIPFTLALSTSICVLTLTFYSVAEQVTFS